MWRKHGQALRERAMSFWGGLNHLYGGSSSGFPLANHLALSGFESGSGLTRALLCVRAHLLAKMDSSARVSGKLTGHIMVWRLLP